MFANTTYKFIGAFLGIVLVAVGGWWVWDGYLSPEAKQRRAANENYERIYKGLVTDFEEAMKADIWGGKTPQETLDLFVAALRAGDVELASKYFHIETNVNDPDYLTKRKWEKALGQAKEEGRLDEIADIVTKAVLDTESGNPDNGTAWFIVLDDKRELVADFQLRLNTRSSVWKIESL